MTEQLVRDIRYGCRGLWRDRSFTAVTVATLAVALALVTVVFAVFNAYVLRPFAVREPRSLHGIVWLSKDADGRRLSWREFQELGERRELFGEVIGEATRVCPRRAGG